MPRVSIIVPAYNRAHLVAHAIDSALAQTMTDREVIVVDDGSTDRTQEVLEAYGSRIVNVRQPHAGAAAARNAGIRQASGDLVMFLDSDDLLSPIAVHAQIAFLDDSPAVDVAYCGWQFISHEGHRVRNQVVPADHDDIMATLVTHGVFYPPPMITGATTVRRPLLDAVTFDAAQHTGEDILFWIRLAERGYRFRCNPQVLYLWRETAGSLGRSLEDIERHVDQWLTLVFDATPPARLAELRPVATANALLGVGNQLLRHYTRTGATASLDRAVACARRAIAADPAVVRRRPEFYDRLIEHASELDTGRQQVLLRQGAEAAGAAGSDALYRQLRAALLLRAAERARREGDRRRALLAVLAAARFDSSTFVTGMRILRGAPAPSEMTL